MSPEALTRSFLCTLLVLVFCGLSQAALLRHHIKRICKGPDIDLLSERGVRIEPVSQSRVQVDLASQMFSSRSKFNVEFEFKTTNQNGVLFYARPHNKPDQSISLVLEAGHLLYKIKCPTLHADIFLSTRNQTALNDNQWHKVTYSVKFKKHGRKGVIAVDGYATSKRYEVSCDYISTILFGGTTPSQPNLENSREHFEGCIRNVKMNTPLQTPPKYHAVSNCD